MNYQNEIHDNDNDNDTDRDCSDGSSSRTTTDDDGVGSMSSIESFSGDLTQLRSVVASINATIEVLETQLISIQRPIEALHVDQLGDVPFLQSSPFRHTLLKFKSPSVGIPGLGGGAPQSKRHTFSDIMAHVRTYLFDKGAVHADGSIHLTRDMQRALGIKTPPVITYIDMMRYMREIVQ
jgi:hypothetical protein